MTTITTSTQTVKDQAWILGKLREGVDYAAIVHELPDADFRQLAQAVRRSDELRPPSAPPPRVAETDDDMMAREYIIAQDRLKQLKAQNTALQAQVEVMTPYAIHGARVVNTSNLLETTLIAKQLNTTAIRLHRFLHEQGVIYHRSGRWRLYAQYANQDLARVVTWRRVGKNGTLIARDMLKWTGKGRMFISNLWHEVHNLP